MMAQPTLEEFQVIFTRRCNSEFSWTILCHCPGLGIFWRKWSMAHSPRAKSLCWLKIWTQCTKDAQVPVLGKLV